MHPADEYILKNWALLRPESKKLCELILGLNPDKENPTEAK